MQDCPRIATLSPYPLFRIETFEEFCFSLKHRFYCRKRQRFAETTRTGKKVPCAIFDKINYPLRLVDIEKALFPNAFKVLHSHWQLLHRVTSPRHPSSIWSASSPDIHDCKPMPVGQHRHAGWLGTPS